MAERHERRELAQILRGEKGLYASRNKDITEYKHGRRQCRPKPKGVINMKRAYNYVRAEDVTACKELIRTMIKRDKKRHGSNYRLDESDAQSYAYQAAKFFDVMESEFRYDIEEWANEEIKKVEAKY